MAVCLPTCTAGIMFYICSTTPTITITHFDTSSLSDQHDGSASTCLTDISLCCFIASISLCCFIANISLCCFIANTSLCCLIANISLCCFIATLPNSNWHACLNYCLRIIVLQCKISSHTLYTHAMLIPWALAHIGVHRISWVVYKILHTLYIRAIHAQAILYTQVFLMPWALAKIGVHRISWVGYKILHPIHTPFTHTSYTHKLY